MRGKMAVLPLFYRVEYYLELLSITDNIFVSLQSQDIDLKWK
jgi:hypothetical protein